MKKTHRFTRLSLSVSFAWLSVVCTVHAADGSTGAVDSRIDRLALVTRHNVTLTKADPLTPLSVGNGEFAFTADVTGLQTFPEYYEKGMPLGTLSQWGWHSLPNPQGYRMADVLEEYEVAGRKVPYASGKGRSGGYSAAADWLRGNPHRLDLGRIGLRLTKGDGSAVAIEDLGLGIWDFQFGISNLQVSICNPSPHRSIRPVRKFIAGLPINAATNRLAGRP